MNKPKVARPPSQRAGFLGAIDSPSLELRPADNMKAGKTADMTFRMDPDWHTEFKQAAAAQRISMKEFLIELFEMWKREKSK